MYILAGDAGGTKTILALYHLSPDSGWQIYRRQQFASADFTDFDLLLADFLADYSDLPLQAACIGVAGPIIGGNCLTTNLPWKLKSSAIGRTLRASKVKLLNDLEAAAWGVMHSSTDEQVELNPQAEQDVAGNKAVIAAGTGLGEAILYWDGQKHHVLATEGGHTDFGANDEQQDALLRYLRTRYSGHVSYERLVSGEGLRNIYAFLKDSGFAEEADAVRLQMQQQDPAAVIGVTGVQQRDPLCREALRLFCTLYGAETGNLALKCLPYGGIYLTGGIAAKILPALQQGEFMQAYLGKGRYESLLSKIPLKVCLNADVALFGAFKYALSLL
ncbi:MAG: glucokinase [Gammaproteobacteria bacterium]